MRRKIYQLRKSISLFFLIFSLKINSKKLCAFIIWLNIRKLRSIKYKNKNVKKVLVFSKSGGNEDLIESFRNQKNNNIAFFWIPRSFLKKIYFYHFNDPKKEDYFTKPTNAKQIYNKKLYIKFLTSSFNFLDKLIKLDGFISFNIFYYAEKYFEEVCINLNKKFIILHKESALSPKEEIYYAEGYKKYNEKSLSYKISVYSESQKQMLIRSKIATKKQIIVNGCPRSDFSFRMRKIKPDQKIIVFYLIETKRFIGDKFQRLLNKSNFTWEKLYNQTLKYLIEYASNNSEVKVILKGKTGSLYNKDLFISKILPKNCTFIHGGTGEKFLKDAKVVIAFNSTIVFETIASNRNLIIPNFNNENKKNKELMHQIENKKYFVKSKNQFNKKLDNYLNSKHMYKELTKTDKKTLKYYLGNTDGKSSKRMKKFLIKSIN